MVIGGRRCTQKEQNVALMLIHTQKLSYPAMLPQQQTLSQETLPSFGEALQLLHHLLFRVALTEPPAWTSPNILKARHPHQRDNSSGQAAAQPAYLHPCNNYIDYVDGCNRW